MRLVVAPLYTYTIGRSLYVPITCRCNSKTLPETRGPGFALPSEIVAALCRFRDLELDKNQWTHWCNWLDTQESKQHLPEAVVPKVVKSISDDTTKKEWTTVVKEEVMSHLERNGEDIQEINLGGEGEPTLDLDTLETFAKCFSSTTSQIPIKVRTNGLIDCTAKLKDWGISSVSVALMTHDAEQYNQLMDPLMDDAYEHVCHFIEQAVEHELKVEVTGVESPDIDKEATQQRAFQLGVKTDIRWRPYFP